MAEVKTIKPINEFLEVYFGTPWRMSDNSLGLVVPIIAKDGTFQQKREYIMMEELKDKADIKDSGSIQKVKIAIKSKKPVFVRSGTAFKGQGTQSRASEYSVIIMPEEKETEIPVRCIHATHGISSGSSFTVKGCVPSSVHLNLCSGGGQGAVWSSVSNYSMRCSAGNTLHTMDFKGDDLVGTMTSKAKEKITDFVKDIPGVENQVGVAIIDEKGVYAVEMFDHPDSWKAYHESILNSYEEIITSKRDTVFEIKLNESKIGSLINDFLAELRAGEKTKVRGEEDAKTFSIKSAKIIGEYSTLHNVMIHLFGARAPPVSPVSSFSSSHNYVWPNSNNVTNVKYTYTTTSKGGNYDVNWK